MLAVADWELTVHKKNTQRFIAGDPTIITLIPQVETWVDGSKIFTDGKSRDEQIFKVIWQQGVPVVIGPQTIRRFDFILVGNYDAEIAIGDHWKINDQKYLIEYLYPFNGYEVKAGGISIGDAPNA